MTRRRCTPVWGGGGSTYDRRLGSTRVAAHTLDCLKESIWAKTGLDNLSWWYLARYLDRGGRRAEQDLVRCTFKIRIVVYMVVHFFLKKKNKKKRKNTCSRYYHGTEHRIAHQGDLEIP